MAPAAVRLRPIMCMRVLRLLHVTGHRPLMRAVPCAAAGIHVCAHSAHNDDVRALQALVGVLRGAHCLPALYLCHLSLERCGPLFCFACAPLDVCQVWNLSCKGALTKYATLPTLQACSSKGRMLRILL